MATYYVVWETVAGRGSRAFATHDEAAAWLDSLEAHGIKGAWVYASWTE